MVLLALERRGTLLGAGTIIQAGDRWQQIPLFSEYGFTPADLKDLPFAQIWLATRLVLDVGRLTGPERMQGLKAMQLQLAATCFRNQADLLIGLPDVPRMTRLYALLGMRWRVLSDHEPFPGGIPGYRTVKAAMTWQDLSPRLQERVAAEWSRETHGVVFEVPRPGPSAHHGI